MVDYLGVISGILSIPSFILYYNLSVTGNIMPAFGMGVLTVALIVTSLIRIGGRR